MIMILLVASINLIIERALPNFNETSIKQNLLYPFQYYMITASCTVCMHTDMKFVSELNIEADLIVRPVDELNMNTLHVHMQTFFDWFYNGDINQLYSAGLQI